MIAEVEVISPGGIPVYYHHNDNISKDESKYLLQASFITALTQFANELNNGEIKLISMEKKKYLLKKTSNFTFILTTVQESTDQFLNYEADLHEISNYFIQRLYEYQLDPEEIDVRKFEKPMNDFSQFLKDKQLIQISDPYDSQTFSDEINSLVFRSVGYEPGKCNIGKGERMKRLAFGMVFFALSFILLTLILSFDLPIWTRAFLVIPNFFGFLGFFQYFYRFCTTNALQEQYDMT